MRMFVVGFETLRTPVTGLFTTPRRPPGTPYALPIARRWHHEPDPAGAIPSASLIVDGFLLLLLTMASAFVIFALLMLWTLCSVTRERRRFVCPIQMRPARVLFSLTPTGRRADVVRCSVFGGRPITCGKMCLPDTGGAP